MANPFNPDWFVPAPTRRWVSTCEIPPNLSVAVLIAQGQQVGGNRPGVVSFVSFPILRWEPSQDTYPNLLITTLAIQFPFKQLDWPPPFGYRYMTQTDQIPSQLALGITVPPTAPGGTIQGQAFGTKITAPQDPPNIISLLQTIAPTLPKNTSDFPSPQKAKWITDTYIPNVTINLPTPSNIVGGVTQAQAFKRYQVNCFDAPNVTINLPVGTKPFAQTDWPSPPRSRPINQIMFNRTVIPRSVSTGTSGVPFIQSDFPVIFKAAFAWDSQPPPNLTLQLSQPIIVPPFADFSLPDIGRWSPQTDATSNLLITTLAAPNVQPQPNPPHTQVYSRWINPVDPVTNQLPLGFTLPPAPFVQTDWPPPFKTSIRHIDAPANLSTLNFVNTEPFHQDDWPRPWGQRFTAVDPPPNLLPTLQFVAPTKPFGLLDWPQVYARPLIGKSEEWPNIILSVNQPNPKPFKMDDYPLPFRARWNIWVDQLVNSPLVTISPTPTPPFPAIPGSGLGREGGALILQPKKLGETLIIAFDFISILAQGETLASGQVICTVYSGNDPNPQAMVPTTASVAGTQILQTITGGVVGTVYELLCKATTSFPRTPELVAYYVVEPDLA